MHTNMNFPAPLAALGFFAAVVGLFLSTGLVIVGLFARKARRAAYTMVAIFAAGELLYRCSSASLSAATKCRSARARKNISARWIVTWLIPCWM